MAGITGAAEKAGAARMRILLLIRSLEIGGAERQLVLIARGLARRGHAVTVVTFYPGGGLRSELERAAGVRLLCLEKRGRLDLVRSAWRLRRIVRSEGIETVYAFLLGGSFLATLALLGTPATLVWGLRASAGSSDVARSWGDHPMLLRAAPRLSRRADRIIANSHQGARDYARLGMDAGKISVIQNGIDTERFRRSASDREAVRGAWSVGNGEVLVGRIARLSPMKDVPGFLRAASIAARRRPDLRFVCVGNGPEADRAELLALARSLGIEPRLRVEPARTDMPAVLSALDVLCSSSLCSEGFPNVVAEAMACGTPCVVTDVGDSARIVGDAGFVAPPGDPEKLAEAIVRCAESDLGTLGRRARERVVAEFGLESCLAATERALAPGGRA